MVTMGTLLLFSAMLLSGCAGKKIGIQSLPKEAFKCKAAPVLKPWPYTQKDVAIYTTRLYHVYSDCEKRMTVIRELR